jgi:hypothetical protein
MPAQLPTVTYQNGQLTIIAKNSTLGDILEAVHQKTGAELDIPSPATERVVTHLGPGPARDILASLLNGSHFNYVMVGTANNPAALDRVILTPNTGGDAVAPATQAQNAPPPPPAQADQPADDQNTDDFASDDNSNVEEVQPLATDSTGEDQPGDQQAQDQQPNNGPNSNTKTPEQLLLELQQRQQRQIQLQQGQGGVAPTPGAPQGYPLPPGQTQPPQ